MAQTAQDLVDMTTHWLGTPVYGYLGSDYGSDLKEMLQKPITSGIANKALQKLRDDIPIIGALPSSSVNMYAQQVGSERVNIAIDIAGAWVQMDSGDTTNNGTLVSAGGA